MKIVAVIPIKLDSKRLPNKNIKKFTNGKPLCHYICNTLLDVDNINETYVFCSDTSIKKYIPDGIKFLKRSKMLDRDETKINEVLQNFASSVNADIYILAHATAPFIKKGAIEEGLEAVISGNYDSAFSAIKIQDFLWDNEKPLNYDLSNIPRTQDLPALFKETSGFYIFKKEVLLNNNRRIGEKPYIVETDEIQGIDIDEKEDFIIADAIFNHFIKKEGKYNGSTKNT